MSDFKMRVLDPSIDQINKHTDITVTYEQHKKGRTITGFHSGSNRSHKQKKTETKRDQVRLICSAICQTVRSTLIAQYCLKSTVSAT